MPTLYFTQSSLVLNWASASSWQPQQVPTLGDLCIFDSNSATCSLNITLGTCSQIDFTNYTRQFRFNNNALGVYGTISFGVSMGYSFSTTTQFGGYNLLQRGNGNVVTNGATVGVPFLLYGDGVSTTHTITGILNMNENFSVSAGSGGSIQTVNGTTISCNRSLQFNNVGGNSSANGTTGSVNYIMTGTGNLSYGGGSNAGLTTPSLNINTTGTITLTGNMMLRNTTVNWLNGISSGINYFYFTGPGTFNPVYFSTGTYSTFGLGTQNSTATITLLSDYYTIRGVNTIGGTINNNNIYSIGGLTNVTSNLSGTTVLYLTGTGSGSSGILSASTQYALNTVINTPGIISSLSAIFAGSIFTYTAGNVSASNFTLNSPTTSLLTMPPAKFNTVNIGSIANQVNTLLSDWNMTTLVMSAQNCTFTGSNAWITDIFNTTNTVGNNILTLRNGITYSVLRQINLTPQSYGSSFVIQSGASGSYVNLYLAPGATQTSNNLTLRDVNNVGTPLWIYNPTIINSTNIWTLNYLSPQQTTISGF